MRKLVVIYYGVKERLVYPSEIFISLSWGLFELTIMYFLWNSIFDSENASQLFIYSAVSIAIRESITNYADTFIARKIQSGNLQSDLILPMDFIQKLLLNRIGHSVFVFMTSSLPIILLAIYLTDNTQDLNTILFFILSLFLSWTIMFFFQIIISLLALINGQILNSIPFIRSTIIKVFGGFLFPISLYPDWFYKLCKITPFPSMFYLPSTIFMNEVTLAESIDIFINQLFWCFILIALSIVGWKQMIKRLNSYGG